MEATKRPWEAVERQEGFIDIWTEAGETPYTIHVAVVRRLGNGLQEQTLANALLIVQAVNHFEEMRDILRLTIETLQPHYAGNPNGPITHLVNRVRTLLEKIKEK